MKNELQRDSLPELAEAWATLQRYAPLRPIENEEEFERTCALGDLLADAVGDDATHPLYSLFDLVAHLIAQWEDEHVHLPDPPPHDLLRFLLEANDLKPTDLWDIAPPELLGDILSGQRDIDEDLANALSKRFHIDVKAFI